MNRLSLIPILTAVIALAAPAAALGDSSLSTNWAGYAVHRSGVAFRAVGATWRQPAADCNTPYATYEASWVGIGGFNRNSRALEQIGTELDCSSSGAVTSAAWFELVPDPSRRIRMTVRPGDTISAGVTVIGHHVTLTLTDRTRHRSFSKTLKVTSVDVRSAEWIVEAPSECFNDNSCRTLPLTNFGTESFSGARATTTKGRSGPITSRLWGRSRITLAPNGRAYVANGSAAEAKPSNLTGGGSAFEVTYSRVAVARTARYAAPRAAAASERGSGTVNPGGRRG
jgi:hypothetical protein